MFRSEAESIYQAWNTSTARNAVTPVARATGAFDNFRTTGFDVIKNRLTAYQRKHGSRKAAEQTWKLLEKFKRRHGDVIARELLQVLNTEIGIKSMLAQFPASMFANLSDDAREYAGKLDPNNIEFPKTGKRVTIEKMLGKGGMGGAVFLAKDSAGNKYALKHFVRNSHKIDGYNSTSNLDRVFKTNHYLLKYFEAALTTTCIDALTIGRDEYVLLELGEGAVDYTRLTISDILSVFEDMRKLEEYSKNYMGVEVTQDVSVLHLDIHGENLMRFNGKLRLIDFGQALVYSPGQDEMVRGATPIAHDRHNENLYLQYAPLLEVKKAYYDQNKGQWKKYIDDWQKAYREAPEVQLCEGCKRQYPAGLKITECFRCGSKKIVTSKLRQADIRGIANLKGVSPGTIGDNPYANGTVAAVDPKQYGCIVLTAVLIKEIWAAAENGKDLGMGGVAAPQIVNVEVYSQARKGLHRFRSQPQSNIVSLLLMWYDEMMRRLFDGEKFSARDAVTFFGGNRGTQPQRGRRNSVSF